MTHERGPTALDRAAKIASLLVALSFVGCGSTEPRRYRLSGTITYAGQPVEMGEILLEPDTSRGNSGPGGMALIEGGRFDTRAGQGTVGGPHIARILAGRGGNVTANEPYGRLHSPEDFRLRIDLPRHDAEHEFALPSAAAPQP